MRWAELLVMPAASATSARLMLQRWALNALMIELQRRLFNPFVLGAE